MRTVHNHSKTFVNLLLSATIPAVLLVSISAHAKPAAKATAKMGGKAQSAASKRPGVLRLRQHTFPDVTMGTPAAYTALLPANWSAQGKIEWQPVGAVPFPQQMIEITSPQKGRISFEPLMTFTYTESSLMGRQGVAPPADFPQWLAEIAPKANPKMSNVKLVKSSRDAKTEAFLKKMETATGGNGGMEREVHIIVLEYDEDNIRRRDEVNVTYARLAPYLSPGLNTQTWTIAPAVTISAPANQFAAQRPSLISVANTVGPTPQWHIQSQAAIAEMSRQRAANNWAIIKERGRQISQLSDAQYAKYKKDTARSDEAQRQRINVINETDDFRDTNGNIVNLPMHYNHIFSDGKGNYVLSNNSHDKPGGVWKPIKPIK